LKKYRRFCRKHRNHPLDITVHHRKPKSLGGGDDKRNISHVYRYLQEAWHLLFDDHSAPQIVEEFQMFDDAFSRGKPVMLKFEKMSRQKLGRKILWWTKRQRAWEVLFGDLSTLEQKVERANNTYLDPDYRIIVGTVRIKKVFLMKV